MSAEALFFNDVTLLIRIKYTQPTEGRFHQEVISITKWISFAQTRKFHWCSAPSSRHRF